MGRLLILFILVPAAELMLLVALGQRIGVLATVAIIVFTGFLGAFLARRQGLKVWRQLQSELAQGRPPAGTIVEGVLVLVAGAVLMTPGVLTDALGFVLLIPPCRKALRRWLFAWFKRSVEQGRTHVFLRFGGSQRRSPPPGQGPIYDVGPEAFEEEADSSRPSQESNGEESGGKGPGTFLP
ncbi:MAG TPA: FxsA family protein [Acidobacteriota bacterium]|nr:FxsA family protein [Acidobacteriota bacterium]